MRHTHAERQRDIDREAARESVCTCTIPRKREGEIESLYEDLCIFGPLSFCFRFPLITCWL